MFSQQKKMTFAKVLGLTLEELDDFIHRYRGYLNSKLNNESLSYNIVLAGFIYLVDTKKVFRKEPESKIIFGSIKSELVKKYAVEIIELRKDGYGAKRICNAIKERHNADISKSMMDRFLKYNKVKNNGES